MNEQQTEKQEYLQAQLFLAIEKLDFEGVKAAFQAGANANLCKKHVDGATPLMIAALIDPTIFQYSSNFDKLDVATIQVRHTAKLAILELLYRHGADITLKDADGDTALYWLFGNAAQVGGEGFKLEYVKKLIDFGGDINSPSGSGDSLLNIVCQKYSHQGVQSLIDLGLNIYQINKMDKSNVLHLLANDTIHDKGMVPFLASKGVDVNAIDSRGWTPICYANSTKNVESFLSAGANPLFIDSNGSRLPEIMASLGATKNACAIIQAIVDRSEITQALDEPLTNSPHTTTRKI
jgi:ankyrin repeat protein